MTEFKAGTRAASRGSATARWAMAFSVTGVLLPVLGALILGGAASSSESPYAALAWIGGAAVGLLPGLVFGLLGIALGITTMVRRGWRGNVSVVATVLGFLVVGTGLLFFLGFQ